MVGRFWEIKFSSKVGSKCQSTRHCAATASALCLCRINGSCLPASAASQAKLKSVRLRCPRAEGRDRVSSCKSLSGRPVPLGKRTPLALKWIAQINKPRLLSSDRPWDLSLNHPNSSRPRPLSQQHHELWTVPSWQRKKIRNPRLTQDRPIITVKEDNWKVAKEQILWMQHGFLSEDHQLPQGNIDGILAIVLALQRAVQDR